MTPRLESPAIARVSAYAASALVSATFLYHLAHGSKAFLGLLEDDYFYYAVVADRLVSLGRLSFDGTTITNGFHPLWFGVVAALRWLFGGFGAGFYAALTVVSLAAMLATFELGRRLAIRLGASSRFAAFAAAIYATGSAQLLLSGMESVAAIPLFLWLLLEAARPAPVTLGRALGLGFIASLAVLSRLDLAIAVALLVGGLVVMSWPSLAAIARLLAGFAVGGILVPAYLAANQAAFGSPFPVSALAKQLVLSPGFNVTYAKRVALGTPYGMTVALVLPLGLLALLLLVWREPRRDRLPRFVGGVALVFAFTFFLLNARTGWTFFGWYAYPLAPGLLVALVFIAERWGAGLRGRALGSMLGLLLLAVPPVQAARFYLQHGPGWTVADNPMLAMSLDLADRVRDRPGLYAMGAIGGIVAYVLDKPVFQTEGIVADHKLVQHIRRQDPLDDVLREYRVDYLVVSLASVALEQRDGCYVITQPNAEWAGLRTAKLRGEICTEPIVRFVTPKGPHTWSRFSALETLVWDVRAARWRRP
jgi:hypothetical protein